MSASNRTKAGFFRPARVHNLYMTESCNISRNSQTLTDGIELDENFLLHHIHVTGIGGLQQAYERGS